MAAKPSLRDALKSNRASSGAAALADPPVETAPASVAAPARERPRTVATASRVGKTNLTGYFPKAVKKQLRAIANEAETTIEDCLAEALNDFFAKHGKPEIAPRKERR